MATTAIDLPTVKRYASDADVSTLNKAILKLNEVKLAQSSESYSRCLREANILITNLWKAENL